MLPYPNEGHMFLTFPTGIHFGQNLMCQDVVTELGDKARGKVERIAKSQDLLGNFYQNRAQPLPRHRQSKGHVRRLLGRSYRRRRICP